MLTVKPTPEMIEQWKKTFEKYRCQLSANRKTGKELVRYFESKYPFLILYHKPQTNQIRTGQAKRDFGGGVTKTSAPLPTFCR